MRASAGPGKSAAGGRCAVHPARPVFDRCPVCCRPRCHPDAEEYDGRGCEACHGVVGDVRVASTLTELAVRAGLAGLAVALFDGWVETQYVRVHLMSLIAPLVGGLAAAWACGVATGRDRPRLRVGLLGIAAVAAVLGAALAFRVSADGGLSPLHPVGRVGPPYLAALLGVAAWPLLAGGQRRQRAGDGEADADSRIAL